MASRANHHPGARRLGYHGGGARGRAGRGGVRARQGSRRAPHRRSAAGARGPATSPRDAPLRQRDRAGGSPRDSPRRRDARRTGRRATAVHVIARGRRAVDRRRRSGIDCGHPRVRRADGTGDGYAVVVGTGHHGVDPAAADPADVATVSLVSAPPDAAALRATARAAAALAGVRLLRSVDRPHALAFLVPAAEGRSLARAIHSAVALAVSPGAPARRKAFGHP